MFTRYREDLFDLASDSVKLYYETLDVLDLSHLVDVLDRLVFSTQSRTDHIKVFDKSSVSGVSVNISDHDLVFFMLQLKRLRLLLFLKRRYIIFVSLIGIYF